MAFAIVVIVLLVLGLAAVLYLYVRTRAELATALVHNAEVEARRQETSELLDDEREARVATEQDVADLDRELAHARNEIAAATKRAEIAEAAVREAQSRLDAAVAESTSVAVTLDAVRTELATATAALASASTESTDAPALWALELARSERRWQMSVSPGIDVPSPFEDTADPLRLAVEVEASALREEVGTRIDVAWDVDAELPDEASLLVLRLAQELLADAAVRAETLELRVGSEDEGVAVALRALDEDGDVVPVALPELASGRVRPGEDGVWVVTRA
jgi:hypothetical protein